MKSVREMRMSYKIFNYNFSRLEAINILVEVRVILKWILFFGPCIFIIEGRANQRNAQINFSLINLLFFKLLRHVSAT